jgi:small subunit ribosomal protein S18
MPSPVPVLDARPPANTCPVQDIFNPSKALLGVDNEPNPTDTMHSMYKESQQRQVERARVMRDNNLASLNQAAVVQAYMQEMPRTWRAGDVYSPRDLGPGEMNKWKQNRKAKEDPLDLLGIDPLESWKVSWLYFEGSPVLQAQGMLSL